MLSDVTIRAATSDKTNEPINTNSALKLETPHDSTN